MTLTVGELKKLLRDPDIKDHFVVTIPYSSKRTIGEAMGVHSVDITGHEPGKSDFLTFT